jgi:putative transposase
MPPIIDDFNRRCLACHSARRIGSIQAIEQLANVKIIHRIPEYIRSDTGAEFGAKNYTVDYLALV